MDNYFILLLETDSYAGNFERELCAFITGTIGECGVGGRYVEEHIQEKFEHNIINMPDEHGCHRPVTIGCPVKKYDDINNVTIFFDKMPNDEQIKIVKERICRFPNADFNVNSMRILKV